MSPLTRRRSIQALGATIVGTAFGRHLAGLQSAYRFGYASITWGGDDRQAIADIADVGFRGIQMRTAAYDAFHDRGTELTELGPWVMALNGFGEMLLNPQNRCTLHPTAVDAWGIPVLHIDCASGPNELAIHKDMNVTAAEMLEKAGAKNIRPSARISTPGNTNHEMGTVRTARDCEGIRS